MERQTGREGVWDQKWVAQSLLETVLGTAEDKNAWEARVLEELYVDAAAENVRWIEVCQGHGGVTDDTGEVKHKCKLEWTKRLRIWKGLEAKYAGKVSVRFIFAVPKEPKGA